MAKVRKRTWISGGKEKTRWVADYFDQDGKRHIKTFELKRDADDWLSKTQVEVKEGVHTPDHNSITVNDAINLWAKNKEIYCRRSSMETFSNNIGRLRSAGIDNVKLSRLTEQNVWNFFEDVAREVTPSAAHRALEAFKELVKFAKRGGFAIKALSTSWKQSSRRLPCDGKSLLASIFQQRKKCNLF